MNQRKERGKMSNSFGSNKAVVQKMVSANALKSRSERLKTFLGIFDALRVGRDDFRSTFDNAKAAAEAEKETYRRGMIGTMLRDKLAEIDGRYTAEVNEKREQLRSEMGDIFATARLELHAELLRRDEKTTQTLRDIEDVPLTREEFRIIGEYYAGVSYWSDRQLSEIAGRNGIEIGQMSFTVMPPVGESLAILDDLQEQFDDLLRRYDGSGSYETMVLLSDKRLAEGEKRATRGMFNEYLDADAAAWRLLSAVRSETQLMNRVMILRNGLQNASEAAREAIFAELGNGKDDTLVSLLGLTSAVKPYADGDASRFADARTAFERALAEGKKDDAGFMKVILENRDNPFVLRRVERAAKSDGHIRELASQMNEACGETLFAVEN